MTKIMVMMIMMMMTTTIAKYSKCLMASLLKAKLGIKTALKSVEISQQINQSMTTGLNISE